MIRGYKRDIVMRIVPSNGAETVYWFADLLSDLGTHVKCTPTYPIDMTMRVDINRVKRPVYHATHVSVLIEVLIATMTDQWFVQDIDNALRDRDSAVFLSLDGGVTDREMVWLDPNESAPQPFSGKTCVGATFPISLQTKIPIPPRGPMMTDPGIGTEKLANGAFDEWVDASNPQGWAGTDANLQIDREPTTKLSGAYSAKLTKLATTGTYTFFPNRNQFSLNPAAWYRLRASCRGGQTTVQGLQVILYTQFPTSTGAANRALNAVRPVAGASYNTWADSGLGSCASQDINASGWSSIDIYFRSGPTGPFKRSDVFRFQMQGIINQSALCYYDDVSVYGPVLRPGYSTW